MGQRRQPPELLISSKYVDPSGTQEDWADNTESSDGASNTLGAFLGQTLYGGEGIGSSKPNERLSSRLHVDKQIMGETYDTAIREARDPDASFLASVGLYVAAVAVSPAALSEGFALGVINAPSGLAGGVEDWHQAATTEDPDDALIGGFEATGKLVGVIGVVGSLLPQSWFSGGGGSSPKGVTPQPTTQAAAAPTAAAAEAKAATAAPSVAGKSGTIDLFHGHKDPLVGGTFNLEVATKLKQAGTPTPGVYLTDDLARAGTQYAGPSGLVTKTTVSSEFAESIRQVSPIRGPGGKVQSEFLAKTPQHVDQLNNPSLQTATWLDAIRTWFKK